MYKISLVFKTCPPGSSTKNELSWGLAHHAPQEHFVILQQHPFALSMLFLFSFFGEVQKLSFNIYHPEICGWGVHLRMAGWFSMYLSALIYMFSLTPL